MMSGLLVAMATVLLAATPAGACTPEDAKMTSQTPSTPQAAAAVEQVYGLWAIQAVGGDGRCRVSLSAQRSGANYGALMERCTIPALAEGATWRPVTGGFELLGKEGRALMRFRMTGLDAFEAVDGRLRGERSPET